MPKIGEIVTSCQSSSGPIPCGDSYWQTSDGETVRLYLGDVLETLRELPSVSVQCVITSPPYWGLRDYGTGKWEGGDPKCKHRSRNVSVSTAQVIMPGFSSPKRAGDGRADHREEPGGSVCKLCGAIRVNDRQIGSEARPDCLGWARGVNCAEEDWENACHVCRMVLVFREVRRVLRDDGCVFLNYGDSYAGGGGYFPNAPSNRDGGSLSSRQTGGSGSKPKGILYRGLTSGNLVGVPWRVALALQADGWILRQDIIWHKPSPMPESVRNRCTKSHEYVFLMTKGTKYFYDAEAIKEESKEPGSIVSLGEKSLSKRSGGTTGNAAAGVNHITNPAVSNKRSVWSVDDHRALLDWLVENDPILLEKFYEEFGYKSDVWQISSQGYSGAHFATFPLKLIEPMILAGTSAKGCCTKCGAPWRRVLEETKLRRERPNDYVKRVGEEGTGNSCANTVAGVRSQTVGWEPMCECEDHPLRPCTVLDPFIGSGTVAVVCLDYGRRCVGIDLSKKYLDDNAIPRIRAWFNARPMLRHLNEQPRPKAVARGRSVRRGG